MVYELTLQLSKDQLCSHALFVSLTSRFHRAQQLLVFAAMDIALGRQSDIAW